MNAIYGSAVYWLSDSEGLIVKTIIENRGGVPVKNTVPDGPIIQENLGKEVSPARTYQDLLANPDDEDLFDYYMTAQVYYVGIGEIKNR